MLLRLAQIVEQLDLALEQLHHGDPNTARFGLMLTDNALELVLHRLAEYEQQKAASMRWKPDYEHPQAKKLAAALGQDFSAKVRFAEAMGRVSPEVRGTIHAGHTFRNETYHVGVQHEEVLHYVAVFYFRTACEVMARIQPGYFGWASSQRMPERAKKYFTGPESFPGSPEDYERACLGMAARCGHNDATLIAALADHMEQVVAEQDQSLDFLATDSPRPTTRKEAVIDAQAWPIAFGEEGRAFLAAHPSAPSNVLAGVEVVAKAFPGLIRSDPIPRWRARARELAKEADPHRALHLYRSFMDQTQELRSHIEHSAMSLDTQIQNEIDRMRGK